MNPEILQNFTEKLRLVTQELLAHLDQDIKIMLAEHSRDGLLGSGSTIKKTMDFIASYNSSLYQATITHMGTLNLNFYNSLESEVQELAKQSQQSFMEEALKRLNKSTEIARAPKLYERMLPEVEQSMENDLANFKNSLNAVILDLKLNGHMTPTEKALWVVEGFLLLCSMFIAGLWYNDPSGNYEPILVALGLTIPLMAIGIKYGNKKQLNK